MSIIGQRFRSERESKGARRVDVAQATKVAVHHLAALEYGDFAALPDAVHTKGYVRAYAEYLGLDPASALAEFLEEYEAACPAATEDHRDEVVRKMSKMLAGTERSMASRLRPVWVGLAIVAVLLLGWFGLTRLDFGGPDSSATPPSEPVAVLPVASPAPSQPIELQPAAEAPSPPAEERTPPAAEPTPQTAAPPESTSSASTGGLSITEYGVGTAVERLRLQGESDRFPVGTRVWFWTRVLNGRSGQRIRHVWRHEGQQIAGIPLTLGSANWRTYSRKTMYAGSVGAWTVEAVDDAGNVLASADFTCDP